MAARGQGGQVARQLQQLGPAFVPSPHLQDLLDQQMCCPRPGRARHGYLVTRNRQKEIIPLVGHEKLAFGPTGSADRRYRETFNGPQSLAAAS